MKQGGYTQVKTFGTESARFMESQRALGRRGNAANVDNRFRSGKRIHIRVHKKRVPVECASTGSEESDDVAILTRTQQAAEYPERKRGHFALEIFVQCTKGVG